MRSLSRANAGAAARMNAESQQLIATATTRIRTHRFHHALLQRSIFSTFLFLCFTLCD